MDKTIERTYFKAFERGGTAYKCVDVIKRKYDLGYLPQNTPEEENELAQLSPEEERERKKWELFYNVVLPDQVIRETESFDFAAINGGRISRIIEEIEANLNECNNEADRERYLFSLLSPFESTINFCYPIANIERLEQAINECKASNDQSEARAYYQKELDRIRHIQEHLKDLCWQKHEKGTIEYCFMRWLGSAKSFSDRLDALLLTYGIDLLELQKRSGIYIKPKCRNMADVACYIGSYELAQHYINALPSHSKPNTDKKGVYKSVNNDTFHTGNDESYLTSVFSKLKDSKYIDANTNVATWLYICGKGNIETFTPINWMRDQQELAYLIDALFGDAEQHIWDITQKVFAIKGSKPNTDSMKTFLSKIRKQWKDKPEKLDKLTEILRA